MWSSCIWFLHPFVPFVILQLSGPCLLSSVSYQNKYESFAYSFSICSHLYVTLSLWLAGRLEWWNSKSKSEKKKKREKKACTCQQTCFQTSYLLVDWISLSIFNQVCWKSLRLSLSVELLTSRRFSNNYLHADLSPHFAINLALSVSYHLLSLHNFLHQKKGFKSISEWQFTFLYNAKRKGILIKKCPFAKAIYSRGAKASLYRRHVLFTSRRTCFMGLNHE